MNQEHESNTKPSLEKALAAWRERKYQNKMAKQQINRTAAVTKVSIGRGAKDSWSGSDSQSFT